MPQKSEILQIGGYTHSRAQAYKTHDLDDPPPFQGIDHRPKSGRERISIGFITGTRELGEYYCRLFSEYSSSFVHVSFITFPTPFSSLSASVSSYTCILRLY